MIALKFDRAVHNPNGPNVTFRRPKQEYATLEPKDKIRVEAELPEKGKVWAEAQVLAVVKVQLVDLSQGWEPFLKMEHDPIARTFGGLVLSLESAYKEPMSMKETVIGICYQIDVEWLQANWPKQQAAVPGTRQDLLPAPPNRQLAAPPK